MERILGPSSEYVQSNVRVYGGRDEKLFCIVLKGVKITDNDQLCIA